MFFTDLVLFRQNLQDPTEPNGCWSCQSPRRPRIGFPVQANLEALGQSTAGCRPIIALCPACAVSFINTFSEAMHKHAKRPGKPKKVRLDDLLRTSQMAAFNNRPLPLNTQ